MKQVMEWKFSVASAYNLYLNLQVNRGLCGLRRAWKKATPAERETFRQEIADVASGRQDV
jgi:hypothetical protein